VEHDRDGNRKVGGELGGDPAQRVPTPDRAPDDDEVETEPGSLDRRGIEPRRTAFHVENP
jgi:hypothetical protein